MTAKLNSINNLHTVKLSKIVSYCGVFWPVVVALFPIKIEEMLKIFLFISYIFLNCAQAQDERYFREIFTGEMIHKDKKEEAKKVYYQAFTPRYIFDLNNDGDKEKFFYETRDAGHNFYIENSHNELLYKASFESVGKGAHLYRVGIHHLNPQTTVLLLYFFEGSIDYLNFQGTSRLYFLTIEDNDLHKIYLNRGPIIWEEFQNTKGHYRQRPFDISLIDYNHDGTREIAVKNHLISRVYLYRGKGLWANF
jgi:hypothetical protein